MSKTFQDQELYWSKVSTRLRQLQLQCSGVPLTQRDTATVCDVLVMNALIIQDLLGDEKKSSNSVLTRWLYAIAGLDLLVWDRICSVIIDTLQTTKAYHYAGFKHHIMNDTHCTSSVIGAILAPVREPLETFIQCHDGPSFKVLYQVFSFSSRIRLEDIDYSDQCLTEWYRNEERLKNLSIPNEILLGLKTEITEWDNHPFSITSLPYHGAGAVAEEELKCGASKTAKLSLTPRTKYLAKYLDADALSGIPLDARSTPSRVIFVPKSTKTWRTICAEPASLMYLQEAVQKSLGDWLSSHPILHRNIRLKDSSFNGKAAKRASHTGKYATIDLSAASDSVKWGLVKSIFSGSSLYPGILLTRSLLVRLPDGNIVEQDKYAPMGSATCFPIECLVFSAICRMTLRRAGYTGKSLNDFFVYGDDIIFPTHLCGNLIQNLTVCGFLVNMTKSHWSGHFRESCGFDYWKGYDVSPVKIPRNFTGRRVTVHTPELFECLTNLCNTFFSHGFLRARSFLLKKILALPPRLRPCWSHEGSSYGLWTNYPTNYDKSKRWNKNLMRLECRCGVITPRYDSLDDTSAYDEALRLIKLYPDRTLPIMVKGPVVRSCLTSVWLPI